MLDFIRNKSLFDELFEVRTKKSIRTNIIEKENFYELKLEVPGFKKDEIEISTEDRKLTVTLKKEEKEKTEGFILNEIEVPSYVSRTFEFKGIDPEKIDAKLEEGILTIKVSKPEKIQTKKIVIK